MTVPSSSCRTSADGEAGAGAVSGPVGGDARAWRGAGRRRRGHADAGTYTRPLAPPAQPSLTTDPPTPHPPRPPGPHTWGERIARRVDRLRPPTRTGSRRCRTQARPGGGCGMGGTTPGTRASQRRQPARWWGGKGRGLWVLRRARAGTPIAPARQLYTPPGPPHRPGSLHADPPAGRWAGQAAHGGDRGRGVALGAGAPTTRAPWRGYGRGARGARPAGPARRRAPPPSGHHPAARRGPVPGDARRGRAGAGLAACSWRAPRRRARGRRPLGGLELDGKGCKSLF